MGTGRAFAISLLVAAGLIVAACGGDGDSEAEPEIVTSTALPATRPPDGASGPGVAVTAIVQACREKSVAGMRSLVPDAVTDAEIAGMFDEGSDVQLLSQSVPEDQNDRVEIDVSLRVTSDAGEEIVQRTWELERDEGVWQATALPHCF